MAPPVTALRWRRLAGLLGAAGLLAAGCGPGGQRTVGAPPAAPAPTAAPQACAPAALSADQHPLSEGTGHYYLAWSLTNTSASACTVGPGVPGLALVDAAGRGIVRYETSSLGGGSAGPVTVAPERSAWFLTEETGGTCTGDQTAAGGPFRYEVHLPGGAGTVTWAPAYLHHGTLAAFCGTVPLAVGGIRSAEPTAP